MVPTWFPALLPGAAAQSLADARRKWAGHESGLQSAPGAGPQLSHEKHGKKHGASLCWNLSTKHGWITWDESDIILLCDVTM